jgi:hypothetical protein
MTAVALTAIETSLPLEVEETDGGLKLRWGGQEVSLRGDSVELRRYMEALKFCYDAGYDEASNPRLFVP